MKKIFLALVLLATVPETAVFAKEDRSVNYVLQKNENGAFVYEGVVNVEGKNQEELFKKAKEWVISNLKTGDNNIQADVSSFTIINSPTIVLEKGGTAMSAFPSTLVNFKLNLQFKDGRYKYVIDNVVIRFSVYGTEKIIPYSNSMVPEWKKYNKHLLEEVNSSLENIIKSLESDMKKSATEKDNW